MLGHSGAPAGKTLSELLQVMLIFTAIFFPVSISEHCSLLVTGMCLAALSHKFWYCPQGRG